MKATHYISPEQLTLDTIREIQEGCLALSSASEERIRKCRSYLEHKLNNSNAPYYGINTGFGSLCDVRIDKNQIEDLQRNLVMSHACGMGEEAPLELIRLIILLKIQSLAYGFSGVRIELVERLVDFYNHNALPVIYQQGSLGASGDLAPLAHLSLALIGKGDMYFQDKKMTAAEVHQQMDWQPLTLQSKEGLALLNGTQFSLAYALWSVLQGERLAAYANLIAAVSLDAFDCRPEPFDDRVHQNRPHPHQISTAASIRSILGGSQIWARTKTAVQDPYAFRCVPQVHGASMHTIQHVRSIVEIELNSVTDNPNIFPDSDAIISGGNFHAQPLALASDFLAIALSELGSISERRIYQLISGKRGLPTFLTDGAGLHSGFMIPQYTAASIASQNKQLCTPASVDSIVSCNGQEDHVSMAANAGTKCLKVAHNVWSLLGIELMIATQGLEYRRPLQSSKGVEALFAAFREDVPRLGNDRILYKDMHLSTAFLQRRNPLDFIPA